MTSVPLVSALPAATDGRPPLLFVHGAWHGAWCWQRHFFPYFRERGWGCHALDLRGHGERRGEGSLRWHRIDDYVDDVAAAAAQLDGPPIVVGHSMGGFVVQRYLERSDPVHAAVLLAPAPASGVLRTTLSIARRHPWRFVKTNATMSLFPLVDGDALAREHFFGTELPDDEVRGYRRQLGDESYRAFLDMLLFVRPKAVTRVPVHVVGAADDTVFTVDEVTSHGGTLRGRGCGHRRPSARRHARYALARRRRCGGQLARRPRSSLTN